MGQCTCTVYRGTYSSRAVHIYSIQGDIAGASLVTYSIQGHIAGGAVTHSIQVDIADRGTLHLLCTLRLLSRAYIGKTYGFCIPVRSVRPGLEASCRVI